MLCLKLSKRIPKSFSVHFSEMMIASVINVTATNPKNLYSTGIIPKYINNIGNIKRAVI